MPTGYQITNQDRPYYLTLQVVEWVDIFTRKVYKDILVDALNYCIAHKGLLVYAYVIMSNHVHLIAHRKTENLSGTIRDLKSFTSKKMLEYMKTGRESRAEWMLNIFKKCAIQHKRNANFQIWTHENHAMEIVSQRFLESKIDYIHNNPVRAGIVTTPENYLYCSAVNYGDEIGLVNVTTLTRVWKTV